VQLNNKWRKSSRAFLPAAACLQETDQGLLNGNPNFIAVLTKNINLVPTDIRGLTFSRTPQQVLRTLACMHASS
jgi:hypothetical protein